MGENPITIDFHRGCLMITTSNRVLLWNVQTGSFRAGTVTTNEAMMTISRLDHSLDHNENFDPRYLQVAKRAGSIILIGTHSQV